MHSKIFVINLDSNPERLDSITKQCERLNLSFERVSAIRGRDLTPDKKNNIYQVGINKQSYDSLLTDGEIGCYLSHIYCWQKMIDEQLDYALILEDDAELSDLLPTYISKLENKIALWDYIELSHGSKIRAACQSYSLGSGLEWVKRLRLNSTTTAQLVSYQGAKRLLSSALPIKRPVDIDLQFWYEKSIRCFSVYPFPVKTAPFASDISAMGRQSRNSSLFRRLIWQTKHKLNLRRFSDKLMDMPFE